MYLQFFDLNEAPFSITPDPAFVYLSAAHRDALAHLLYGVGQGGAGGFVQLTGEVGTGKTTICRAFMEQIPQQVDLALILNPALTVVELLQAICQEFHIPQVQDETSRMVLVDKLNRYLLEAHANGRRPVLMIDEAQNLSPDVLEQLRLLTNLETSKQKLLQIFLIGQPELQEMLQRQELRQLAQRITARYHLTPLSETETADYIRHRLAVAEVERPLFSRSALRQIHKLSGGVPRLINMLCDRALLGAFATHRQTVDASIVRKAAAELQGAQPETGSSWRWLWWFLLTLVLLAGLALTLALTRRYGRQLKALPSLTGDPEDFEERVLTLIHYGESPTLEFKSTMRANLKSGKAGKEIELAWLKGVVGFLNTDGGVLLIGVNDEGEVIGIEADNFENDDKCLLHFKNLINQHVGAEYSKYLQAEVRAVAGKSIVAVSCEKAREPVFLMIGKNEEFHIRSGPSSMKLTPRQMLQYLNMR